MKAYGGHWLEASGQLHAPAVLPPREVALGRRLGGLEILFVRYEEVKIVDPTRTRTPACRQSLYRLSYRASYTFALRDKIDTE
jgi:hypothetical protein